MIGIKQAASVSVSHDVCGGVAVWRCGASCGAEATEMDLITQRVHMGTESKRFERTQCFRFGAHAHPVQYTRARSSIHYLGVCM